MNYDYTAWERPNMTHEQVLDALASIQKDILSSDISRNAQIRMVRSLHEMVIETIEDIPEDEASSEEVQA